jgi:2-polyprenyl-3-methyl-5-hydroxy-6-metoxy-1,4-benzoquinol methylase
VATTPDTISCPLCSSTALVLNPAHPGYQEGETWQVAECGRCDVQFAAPLTPGEAIYERIYEHARTLPGYSRYAWYASQIARRRRPLEWLAAQEEMYAFIAAELALRGPTRTGQVLEVGSGLGYLTFALHAAGYQVRGLELSTRAVEAARSRFGDLFAVQDISRADPAVDGADVVVMTEVLEHVTDPAALIASLARLLRPGGTALVTTPNKSAAPRNAYWLTDNPPVHLWWFSETTLRLLGAQAGLQVSFGVTAARPVRPALPSYFDAAGAQVHPSPLVRSLLLRFPSALHRIAALLRNRRQRQTAWYGSAERHGSMCVVLRKPGGEA